MTHVTKRTMGATEVILQHILHVANQTIKLYFPVPFIRDRICIPIANVSPYLNTKDAKN